MVMDTCALHSAALAQLAAAQEQLTAAAAQISAAGDPNAAAEVALEQRGAVARGWDAVESALDVFERMWDDVTELKNARALERALKGALKDVRSLGALDRAWAAFERSLQAGRQG